MYGPRRARWFVLISRFMRCQLSLSPARAASIKQRQVCKQDTTGHKSLTMPPQGKVISNPRTGEYAGFMEAATETIGLYSRITTKGMNRATSKTKFSLLRCLLLLLALFWLANGIIADSTVLVDQGQRAFQSGAFGQAAADWQKAVESFRSQGNTNAEILTSVSLASANPSSWAANNCAGIAMMTASTKLVIRQMMAMCGPRRTRWFVLISRFMRCQLSHGPVGSAPIKLWHVCNSAPATATHGRCCD